VATENVFDLDNKPLVWGQQIKILSDIWMDARAKGILCQEWQNNHQKFRGVVGVPNHPDDKLVREDSSKLMSPWNFKWIHK
jgi:hypothetical protein